MSTRGWKHVQAVSADSSGNIAVALLLSFVVLFIGGGIAATVAWQTSAVRGADVEFIAETQAYNALVSGMDALQVVDPRSNPTFVGLPVSEPAWVDGLQANTAERWWVLPGANSVQVSVVAEGRAGAGDAAVTRYVARLQYDLAASRWRPVSVQGSP